MASKPKTPQKENLLEVSGRDTFQTPSYAVDLLYPFLNNILCPGTTRIWECAAGLKKISNRLNFWNYDTFSTDLAYEGEGHLNFITDYAFSDEFDAIVTNPPFSIKRKFYEKCLSYKKPFALLIPADYAIWVNRAVSKDGCEKIIPERRVDYVTPDILERIHEGEIWANSKEFYPNFKSLKQFKKECHDDWAAELEKFSGYCRWDSIYDAPSALLKKYSSSQFHSMWLTWGFNIGRTETFVELSNDDKNNI